MKAKARIGIIGGTGVYDPELFKLKETVKLSTPYGAPSDEIQIGDIAGVKVAFLQRHGKGHVIPPHMVNYRANLWALKQCGVERVISPCAVGSLQEEFEPGQIAIVDQFIDFTKKRDYTFFDGPKTMHISTADPFCSELRGLFIKEAKRIKVTAPQGRHLCLHRRPPVLHQGRVAHVPSLRGRHRHDAMPRDTIGPRAGDVLCVLGHDNGLRCLGRAPRGRRDGAPDHGGEHGQDQGIDPSHPSQNP